MEVSIYTTDFAKAELQKIFNYYKEVGTLALAKKILKEILSEIARLQKFPALGAKEELLDDQPEEFRYILCRHYKIIYWYNYSIKRIEIVDVFDTRQSPVQINRFL